jgi:hypothetical protein
MTRGFLFSRHPPFLADRDYRINAGGASGGEPCGNQCDQQKDGHGKSGTGIQLLYP